MGVAVESRKLGLTASNKGEPSLAAFAATDKKIGLSIFPSGEVA
jgi:hypothetical protein